MKITVEIINGKKCTVFWHDRKVGNWSGDYRYLGNGTIHLFNPFNRNHHIATALPALPRHPKREDAPLMYRYMAEGIHPAMYLSENATAVSYNADGACKGGFEITHATHNGERVEIAIEDSHEGN